MKKYALITVILFFFYSCEEEIKPIEFKNFVIEDTFDADIEVVLDKAESNSDISKNINKTILSKVLRVIPISKDETTIEAALTSFDNDYKKFISDFPESKQTWVLSIETELLYKTETVITMVLNVYSDTGGAHGNDSIELLNFNPETGNLFTIDNLFNDINGFKALAETYFLDHMKNEGNDIEAFFFGEDFQLPENIGFNDEGIILLYNVYEIASYSQGYTEFVIPLEKAEAFLKIQLE